MGHGKPRKNSVPNVNDLAKKIDGDPRMSLNKRYINAISANILLLYTLSGNGARQRHCYKKRLTGNHMSSIQP